MAMVMGRGYPEHCSLDEALKILSEEFGHIRSKTVTAKPADALGCILSEDISSKRNVPHYTASAVDGYAMSARSTAGAAPSTPVTLEGGKFWWVNTGAPIGDADSVVMVEDTSMEPGASANVGSERLKIFRSLTQGENVRAVGEDVMYGQLLACCGDKVTPALVSLCLCAGVENISIYAKPRAIFIPTGNEIASAELWLSGERASPGVVVDSNSAYAASIFESWGYSLDISPILPDDPDVISEAARRAASDYDLVIVSAGSAKGRRDHSADIFQKLGKILFRYVRMKPGRPAMIANICETPVICAPGFPMSCAVSLWSFAYPLAKMLSGERVAPDYILNAIGSRESLEAEFMVQHSSPPGVAEWLRMKCARVGENTFCWPLSSGASVLWALAEADGIAMLREESLERPKGSKVQIHLTKRVDLAKRLLFQGSDDPAVGLLVSIMRNKGMDLAIRAVGSMGGLAALARGEAHLAAAHLLDAASGTYNTSYIRQFSGDRDWRRKRIFYREQGIITAPGNPKAIGGFGDLAAGDVVFENRQPGAGTRVLLDYMLRENGLKSSDIRGYDHISITHMEAANKVASGVADATLGIASAADALGLHFIPIAREPYELVFCERFGEHPAAEALFDAIESVEWRDAVSRMGGYEFPETGDIH